jgi:hypothetical protein
MAAERLSICQIMVSKYNIATHTCRPRQVSRNEGRMKKDMHAWSGQGRTEIEERGEKLGEPKMHNSE